MSVIRDTFEMDKREFIEHFELTKVNDDAITSGKEWTLAGYSKGYLHGAITAIDTFSVWRDGKQHINDMRTKKEAVSLIVEALKEET